MMKNFLLHGLRLIHTHATALASRCRLLRDESGNALIETALCVSILGLPMLVGTVEMGGMTYWSVEISNAAHAGAAYGMISSTFAANSSGITAAAQNEASDFGTALTATPTVYYACSNSIGGTQYSTQAAATTGCSGSGHSLEFIQVVTSGTVTPPIHCPGLPTSYTLRGVSVMEVQE
jgi:Flp pilus assembly protein TadG